MQKVLHPPDACLVRHERRVPGRELLADGADVRPAALPGEGRDVGGGGAEGGELRLGKEGGEDYEAVGTEGCEEGMRVRGRHLGDRLGGWFGWLWCGGDDGVVKIVGVVSWEGQGLK